MTSAPILASSILSVASAYPSPCELNFPSEFQITFYDRFLQSMDAVIADGEASVLKLCLFSAQFPFSNFYFPI